LEAERLTLLLLLAGDNLWDDLGPGHDDRRQEEEEYGSLYVRLRAVMQDASDLSRDDRSLVRSEVMYMRRQLEEFPVLGGNGDGDDGEK
jgi:hypothetical protein